jgi:hypothetical protein
MSDFKITVRSRGPLRLEGGHHGMRPAMAPRHCLALLLAAAVFAPGCGGSTPTSSGATRAELVLSVDPNPVAGTQNLVTGSVSAVYKTSITETAGLGGEMVFVSSSVYEPATGKLVALSYYDSSDLIVYVGSKRLEPGGTLVVPQTVTYTLSDLSKPATLVIAVQLKDDQSNLINTSLLVKIE